MGVLLLASACSAPEADSPAAEDSASAEVEAVDDAAEAEDAASDAASADTEPADEPAAAEEMIPLKVVTLPFISFAPFFIAVEEGYFADQGLDVELIAMSGMGEIVPALVSGEVDVASGLVSAGIMNAIARGGNVKFTADKGYVDPAGCPNYALIARSELVDTVDFNDPAAWAGLKVDSVPTTWLDYYLDVQLEAIGVDLDAIERTNTLASAEPEALAQGAIDVTLNNEPWLTIHARSGHMPILSPVTEIMADSQSAVIFYGPSILEMDASVGVRFMTAYLQAARQYNEGKTERNLEVLLQYIDMNPDLMAGMCWPTLRDDGSVNMESVLDFQDWAVAKGIMDTAIDADDIYDSQYIDGAVSALDG